MSRLFDGTKQGKLHREHSEFLSHTSTPMRIEAIQFSLLSERDVTRLSEVELTQKLLYSPDDRTLPAENGPLDRRLGVSARNALCATCGATLADCAGHFGRIELCLPVFHVGYFNAVKSLLERICKCCSRILLSETERSQLLANVNSADAHLRAAARRDAHKLAKRSKWRCHWCAAYNGPVKKVTGMLKLLHERFAKPNKAAEHAIANRDVDFVAGGKFELSTLPPFVEFSEAVANHSELSLLVHKAAEDLNPLHVHQLLSRIEDDDCLLLGLNPAKARPELLMLTSLIVPPVCLRPSLSRDPSSGTTEDDLTVQLSSIIHYNELIKKQLNLVHGATTREALIAGATSGGAATMAAVAAAAAAAASGAAMAVAAVSSSSSSSLLAAPGGGMGGAGSADAVAAAAKAPSLATVQGQWSHLQCIVAQYINSDMPGVSKATFSSTTYRRSLCQRLKGKQGRFRGNLSGKRVDFSGRTVISPDPNLHVEEVGIPTDVAKIMTYPERVFNKNIDYLRELVRRGADEWPGATHVRNEQGDRALRFADRERTAQHLKPGDIVMRHMRHGDILLFNRQPSLHRVSIMAFKARVMAGRTFRFNECACVSFNADFDGDEMNIHLPQTEEARAESRELMSVVCNLVTPRTGDILVAATQDFLSCSFLLSKRDRFFTRAQIMQLCWHMMGVEGARDAAVAVHLPQPTILRPKQLWTGKQMIELILCPTRADRARVSINLFAKTKMMTKRPAGDTAPWMCARDGCLIIRDSQLLSGWLEKSVLGSSGQKNNLFHALLRDVDAAAAALCMTRLARLCARTIGEFGFTFGIEDVTASPALLAEKAALIKSGYAHCDTIIRQYRENRLDAQPGCSIEETLESKLTGELGSLRQRAGELCILALPAHNAPLIMSQCGSKGSLINISQMIAIVGQQQVGGARIQDGFERRTLPHFARNSREPAAKGFVANSFQSGLTPTEFFFHTMGGREGLVDTAVKTAETGYLQRKMMKSLEDLSVQYDGSVRTSSGNVVQFEYGDDQLDPLCMEQAQNPVDFERQMSRIVAANVNREPNLRPHALQRLAAGWLQWHLQKERNTSSPLFARQVLQYLCGLPPGPGDASAAENEPYLYAKPGAPPSLLAQLISLRKSLGLPETKAYAMEELHTALGWRVIFAKGATRDDVKHEADKIEALAMAAAGRVEQSHDALDVDRPDNAPVVSPARLDPQLVAACAVDATKEARIRVYASDFDGDECDAVSVRLLAKLVRITAAQLMTFINVVVKKHQLARIEPGSAVGALAAQSIGEPATQMTLKTFHFAGVASMNVTLGVPRIKEILNASKTITTPLITVQLLENTTLEAARRVKNSIERTVVSAIAKGVYSHVQPYNVFVDLVLDVAKCQELGMTAFYVAHKLKHNAKLLKIVEESDIDAMSADTVRILCGWGDVATDSDAKAAPVALPSTGAPAKAKKTEDKSISAKVRRVRTLLPTLAVCGIPSISRAVVSENNKRFELLCEGTGLLDVAGQPGVRASACKTNHIAEIFEVLGIEATRAAIQHEVRSTVDAYGISIDPRHLTLLADLMTCKGEVLGISRFGITKMKDSVMMLASFEKTTDHLFEAALKGKTDLINGVSDSIIMGAPMRVGTGMFRLFGRNVITQLPKQTTLLSQI